SSCTTWSRTTCATPRKGRSAVSASYRTTPRQYRSLRRSTLPGVVICSGLMYAGVPTTAADWLASAPAAASRASPQSAILARPGPLRGRDVGGFHTRVPPPGGGRPRPPRAPRPPAWGGFAGQRPPRPPQPLGQGFALQVLHDQVRQRPAGGLADAVYGDDVL